VPFVLILVFLAGFLFAGFGYSSGNSSSGAAQVHAGSGEVREALCRRQLVALPAACEPVAQRFAK
jgi:hypothetical protein